MKILVSAGEASGDRYAAELVQELQRRLPSAEFFGCAGAHLRESGVHATVRAEDLAVVGIFEVVRHIPRIRREFDRLVEAAERYRPALAVLVDSPDFNLRLARKLRRARIPVIYYVAPQVWAWRKGRISQLREYVDHLLCIFPFEEDYFRKERVRTTYVGHPLAHASGPGLSRKEFLERYGLNPELRLVPLLPGSRREEAERHLGPLMDAVRRLKETHQLNFVLPASTTTGRSFFAERISEEGVHIMEGETANALGHADLALVASGTVTVEAALLGAPMVVFYRVSSPSWVAGRLLVDVPFFSMVNLLAARGLVPELIQGDCTGERIAAAARQLLDDQEELNRQKQGLEEVARGLKTETPPAKRAADVICDRIQSGFATARNFISPVA